MTLDLERLLNQKEVGTLIFDKRQKIIGESLRTYWIFRKMVTSLKAISTKSNFAMFSCVLLSYLICLRRVALQQELVFKGPPTKHWI